MCYGTARTMCRTRAYAHYTRTFTRDASAFFPSLSSFFYLRFLFPSLSLYRPFAPRLSPVLISLPFPFLYRRHKDRTQ